EPRRVALRVRLDAGKHLADISPTGRGNLRRIGPWMRVGAAGEHVVELVLDEARSYVGAVEEREGEVERAVQPELLPQTAVRRVRRPLARPRMTATGVRPQAAGVVFLERALLQQHLRPGRVEDEDRDGAVQPAVGVHVRLRGGSDLAIVFVDENDVFGHSAS